MTAAPRLLLPPPLEPPPARAHSALARAAVAHRGLPADAAPRLCTPRELASAPARQRGSRPSACGAGRGRAPRRPILTRAVSQSSSPSLPPSRSLPAFAAPGGGAAGAGAPMWTAAGRDSPKAPPSVPVGTASEVLRRPRPCLRTNLEQFADGKAGGAPLSIAYESRGQPLFRPAATLAPPPPATWSPFQDSRPSLYHWLADFHIASIPGRPYLPELPTLLLPVLPHSHLQHGPPPSPYHGSPKYNPTRPESEYSDESFERHVRDTFRIPSPFLLPDAQPYVSSEDKATTPGVSQPGRTAKNTQVAQFPENPTPEQGFHGRRPAELPDAWQSSRSLHKVIFDPQEHYYPGLSSRTERVIPENAASHLPHGHGYNPSWEGTSAGPFLNPNLQLSGPDFMRYSMRPDESVHPSTQQANSKHVRQKTGTQARDSSSHFLRVRPSVAVQEDTSSKLLRASAAHERLKAPRDQVVGTREGLANGYKARRDGGLPASDAVETNEKERGRRLVHAEELRMNIAIEKRSGSGLVNRGEVAGDGRSPNVLISPQEVLQLIRLRNRDLNHPFTQRELRSMKAYEAHEMKRANRRRWIGERNARVELHEKQNLRAELLEARKKRLRERNAKVRMNYHTRVAGAVASVSDGVVAFP